MTYAEYTAKKLAHETSMVRLYEAEVSFNDYEKNTGERPTAYQLNKLDELQAEVDQALANLLPFPLDYVGTEASKLATYQSYYRERKRQAELWRREREKREKELAKV